MGLALTWSPTAKGVHFESKASEQEKHDIGREWERRSGGKAIFFWAVKQDAEGRSVTVQLKAKIEKR